MKKIYLMLTRTESFVSKTVHMVTKDSYTHASLAFDENLTEFYSSTRKNGKTIFPAGPSREYLGRGFFARYGRTPCALYELEVEDSVYDKAFEIARSFADNQKLYKFNAWGLITCRFGVPLYRKNKFFCSQFVAEVLNRANAVELPKESGLIRPSDYMKVAEFKCVFTGDIKDVKNFKELTTIK